MRKIFTTGLLFGILLSGCSNHSEKKTNTPINSEPEPLVKEDGKFIEFPANSTKTGIFKSEIAASKQLTLSFSAPANVIGRVHSSGGTVQSKIILFDSPDLTNIYSTYLQNITLLKTARINFDRVSDLFKNGAATGKEFNDASTEMLNIETALASSEAQLRESGLHPENMNNAPLGTVWLICDLPESELNSIKKGQKYNLLFPSFPNEIFVANIDVIADVMNSQTRKIRVRLSLSDKQTKIRPGMYAQVNFEVPHEGLMVPRKSVISANARYYVFVKKCTCLFERREVAISSETGDYIEIAGGVSIGEEVVSENVYLLKGIDMGI
ncbi:MAG: efflux RND transporter periplasmic adaptor subunit [Prolixibacteraceae bacterium]